MDAGWALPQARESRELGMCGVAMPGMRLGGDLISGARGGSGSQRCRSGRAVDCRSHLLGPSSSACRTDRWSARVRIREEIAARGWALRPIVARLSRWGVRAWVWVCSSASWVCGLWLADAISAIAPCICWLVCFLIAH